jgi:hypothetical protein
VRGVRASYFIKFLKPKLPLNQKMTELYYKIITLANKTHSMKYFHFMGILAFILTAKKHLKRKNGRLFVANVWQAFLKIVEVVFVCTRAKCTNIVLK